MENNAEKKSYKPLIVILSIACVLLICVVGFLLIYPMLSTYISSDDSADNNEKHVSTVVSKVYLNGETFVEHIEDVTGVDIPDSYTSWSTSTERDTFRIEFNEHHNTIDYYTSVFFYNTPKEKLEAFEKQIEKDEHFRTALGDMKKIVDTNGGEVLEEYKLVYVMDTEQFNTLPDKEGEYRIITMYYDTDLKILSIKEYNNNYYKPIYLTQ